MKKSKINIINCFFFSFVSIAFQFSAIGAILAGLAAAAAAGPPGDGV
jgi:hypothetical protein